MKNRPRISSFALLVVAPLAGCGADASQQEAVSSTATAQPHPTASQHASSEALASPSPTSSTSAGSVAPPAPAPGPRPSDADLTKLTKANNSLAFALWKDVAKKNANTAFSPFSIESALTMAWLGAKGETASQMKKVLGFDDESATAADVAGRYTKSLGGPLTIRVANRLFGEKSTAFEKAFIDATDKDFGAPIEALDFKTQFEPARAHINDWVASETHDRIQGLLPEGSLKPETRLVLVNASYFLGNWGAPFQKESTKAADFHTTAAEQHDVPTMNSVRDSRFAEDDDVSVLDLAYEGGAFSMTFVLPKKTDGLEAVEKKLSPERFDKWVHALAEAHVNIALPKFTVAPASAASLTDSLSGLGMTDAFDGNKADFTGIANPPNKDDRLFLSKVFHNAFVAVDEKGTEAAAATGVTMSAPTAVMPQKQETKEFKADHPFLFFLRDAKSNTIVFAGHVADPAAK